MQKRYTTGEEIANCLTHGIGIIIGIIAGFFLMAKAIDSGSSWEIGSVCLYLFGMLSSYIASTWYHGCVPVKRKEILRKFDHAAIYWHIAGTYSPITLVLLRDTGYWGWGLFIFVWLCAIAGTILSFTNLKEHSNLETICFIAMGCCIFVAFKPLIDTASAKDSMGVVWWLMAGGVFYIVGAVFYSWRKVRYMHSIFHLFCLGGSLCHLVTIYKVL